jgi:hypothetical protein
MPRCWRARRCLSARAFPAARVHLGRRGAAGGHRQALDGSSRRRDPRRHRLHRDAAHLPFQPCRRSALRHHRQGGARLRGAPDRRGRQRGAARRDRRAADQGPERGGAVLEQPREVAPYLHGRLDAQRRQVHRIGRRLLPVLRPFRRHAEGFRHLCVALRGRGRADDASGHPRSGRGGPCRHRRADQAQGLCGAEAGHRGVRQTDRGA